MNQPSSQDLGAVRAQIESRNAERHFAFMVRPSGYPVTWNHPQRSTKRIAAERAFEKAVYNKRVALQQSDAYRYTYAPVPHEVVIEALKKVSNPHDRAAVAAALKDVRYDGMLGPLDFAAPTNPVKGVALLAPVGLQWKPGSSELVGHRRFAWSPWVVDNTLNRDIPLQASLEPTNA